jgi:acylphosphatase
MARTAMRILVEGHVQGVGFRWWTAKKAERLGVDGWVRNLSDGHVEILAIGEADAIGDLALACHEGPHGAAVRSVVTQPAEDDGSQGFRQRATV